MKRLDKTETLVFVIFLCFQRQTFIFLSLNIFFSIYVNESINKVAGSIYSHIQTHIVKCLRAKDTLLGEVSLSKWFPLF